MALTYPGGNAGSAFQLTGADIADFADGPGRNEMIDQFNFSARLYAALPKVKYDGEHEFVSIMDGGEASVTQAPDGGLRPEGSSSKPALGVVDPVIYTSRVVMTSLALKLAKKGQGAGLAKQMKSCAKSLARQACRALYGSQLGAPVSVSSDFPARSGNGFVGVFDGAISDFRPKEAYEFKLDDSASDGYTVGHTLLCDSVVITGDFTTTVTFTNRVPGFGGTGGTVATGAATNHTDAALIGKHGLNCNIFLRGTLVGSSSAADGGTNSAQAGIVGASAAVSLQQITDATTAVHGITAGLNGWSGITATSVGVPTPELIAGKCALIQGWTGENPDMIVMANQTAVTFGVANLSATAQVYGSTDRFGSDAAPIGGQVRKNIDGSVFGKYSGFEESNFRGQQKMIIDSNCPTTDIYLLNSENIHVAEWSDGVELEKEGSDGLLLSRSRLQSEFFYSLIYNVVTNKRDAHARLSGVTP